MVSKGTIFSLAVMACLAGGIYFLYQENKVLQKDTQVLDLSVSSLRNKQANDELHIGNISAELQMCIDSKGDMARQFDAISYKYRSAKTEQVKDGGVIDEKLRKELREELIRPLPAPVSRVQH